MNLTSATLKNCDRDRSNGTANHWPWIFRELNGRAIYYLIFRPWSPERKKLARSHTHTGQPHRSFARSSKNFAFSAGRHSTATQIIALSPPGLKNDHLCIWLRSPFSASMRMFLFSEPTQSRHLIMIASMRSQNHPEMSDPPSDLRSLKIDRSTIDFMTDVPSKHRITKYAIFW